MSFNSGTLTAAPYSPGHSPGFGKKSKHRIQLTSKLVIE